LRRATVFFRLRLAARVPAGTIFLPLFVLVDQVRFPENLLERLDELALKGVLLEAKPSSQGLEVKGMGDTDGALSSRPTSPPAPARRSGQG
jgi:hypothetical protein